MSNRQRQPNRRAVALVVGLIVLVGIGLIGGIAGPYVWGWRHYQAAQRALQQHDYDQAREHLTVAVRVWPRSGPTRFLAARTTRRAGAYDEAAGHLLVCEELGMPEEPVAIERALLRVQQGNPAPVAAALLAYVKNDHPDSVLILEALAQGYLKAYAPDRALFCLEQWLRREPDHPQALYWRGLARELTRDRSGAREDFERVLEQKEDHAEARLRLAELLLSHKRYAAALPHFEWLHARRGNDPKLHRDLALCRLGLGQREEARELLNGLLQADPRDPVALRELGQMALAAERDEEAENLLRRAVAVDPHEPDTVYAFYLCLQKRGKDAEAVEWSVRLDQIRADLRRVAALNEQILRSPSDPALRHAIGVIFLSHDQEKEGLRWLASALQLDPRHRPTHQALADYFERQGKKDLADYHRGEAVGSRE
jgi:tetratricopeptide (TPR) repeat protein